MKPDSQGSATLRTPGARWRLDNRGDIQQMRAQPATSEVRRLAAQLVAYGGSRTGSMREGAHPGQIAAYPAEENVPRGRAGRWDPFRDAHRSAGWTEEYDEGADHPRAGTARPF